MSNPLTALADVDLARVASADRLDRCTEARRMMTCDQTVGSAEHAFLVQLRESLALGDAETRAARERAGV